jgi:hypothetical protein
MTESEWLTWTDPRRVLDHLWDKVGPRQKRLCAAACCRRIEHLIRDDRYQRMIDVVERYADRRATGLELVSRQPSIDR